ncbi:hypothetical protein [Desulfosporosinus sp.]|uniref:hypothetical protein n=1 Tax=Desulfosporosinus sp. TaxID=157907 RepID=UPI002606DA72|nr:hypothetical protein [Desulfosporosinus sp.]MCO5385303.1 hypothetical protein [Desulfosporosinus sp.]
MIQSQKTCLNATRQYSTSDGGGIISAEQMLISIFSLLTNRLRGSLRRVAYSFAGCIKRLMARYCSFTE